MNVNRVIISGNLTRDPDMRITGGGTPVCKMRVAVNTRRRNNDTGTWEEKPNYFNVTVFGKQGENCGQYLSRGRGVIVDGRLDWHEWETEGQKRQAVDIIAENVQFLQDGRGDSDSRPRVDSDIPADTSDFDTPVATGVSDDDIPF